MKSIEELKPKIDAIYKPTDKHISQIVNDFIAAGFILSAEGPAVNREIILAALKERAGNIEYHNNYDTDNNKATIEVRRLLQHWVDEQIERQIVMAKFTAPLPVFSKNVGKGNVRKLSEAKFNNTEEAAYRSSINRERFSDIERGITKVLLHEAEAIANALEKPTIEIWPNGKIDQALRLQIKATEKMLYDIDQIKIPANFELDPLVEHLLNGEFYRDMGDSWESRRLIRGALRCGMRAIKNSSVKTMAPGSKNSLSRWLNCQFSRYLNN